MESSESEDELFPILEQRLPNTNVFLYDDPLSVSGILRAVVEEDCEKVERLIKCGKSININDNNGNTALHVSVIKNNLKILDFLLAQDDVVINTRNFQGETPLFQAVKNGKLESAKRLIHAGANVNLSNYEDVTPLHVSVIHPDIAYLLITNGAKLNVVDYSGDTPLHDAVAEGCLETVCMFLYYNADANSVGGNNLTPFMKALIGGDVQIQDALFEYVSDFNVSTLDNISMLALGLIHDSRYVKEIIEKGALVCDSHFYICLQVPDQESFRLIWDRLEYTKEGPIMVGFMFQYLQRDDLESFMEIIIESPNMKVFVQSVSQFHYCNFIRQFADHNLKMEQLARLTCLMLLNEFQLAAVDIYEVFVSYGYCELVRILLYMEYKGIWLSFMMTPRLIFDIHNDLGTIFNAATTSPRINRVQFKYDLETCLEYVLEKRLIELYNSEFDANNFICLDLLPKVPLLIELARNKTREYIVKNFNISTTCQYYTLVDHLNISSVYKKILKFEKKLYKIKM